MKPIGYANSTRNSIRMDGKSRKTQEEIENRQHEAFSMCVEHFVDAGDRIRGGSMISLSF